MKRFSKLLEASKNVNFLSFCWSGEGDAPLLELEEETVTYALHTIYGCGGGTQNRKVGTSWQVRGRLHGWIF